ncbi:MAG: hypothetical protein BGO89_04120 [Candidatus Kapaibacterium thiocyanatum]|uniref:Uncharacterized protein n=1 Tax=Candidatus Kapaibacterium thiocyanatum TaxID=1895771 RepID=A0A1M3L5C8_9BACT|nr:MAG: hypothetical protein BGO89_04120 ['Candidatus Kapabacteria' thiocyanatum]
MAAGSGKTREMWHASTAAGPRHLPCPGEKFANDESDGIPYVTIRSVDIEYWEGESARCGTFRLPQVMKRLDVVRIMDTRSPR